MSNDDFNSTAQRLLRDGDANGGLTNKSLFDLIVASHNESVASAKAIANELRATRASDHVAAAELIERHDDLCARIISLEEWKLDSQRTCVDRVKRLIDEEHRQMHGQHMETHHNDEDARQTWLMWLVGGKVAYIIIAVVIAFLVTLLNVSLKYVWFGTP